MMDMSKNNQEPLLPCSFFMFCSLMIWVVVDLSFFVYFDLVRIYDLFYLVLAEYDEVIDFRRDAVYKISLHKVFKNIAFSAS